MLSGNAQTGQLGFNRLLHCSVLPYNSMRDKAILIPILEICQSLVNIRANRGSSQRNAAHNVTQQDGRQLLLKQQ